MTKSLFFFFCLTLTVLQAQDSTVHQLYFSTNRHILTAHHKEQLLDHIKDLDTLTQIEIKGYTDFVGSQSANQTLSENRANSVVQFLSQHHFNNIDTQGHGEIDNKLAYAPKIGIKTDRKVVVRYTVAKVETETEVEGVTLASNSIAIPKKYRYLKLLDSLTLSKSIRLKNINFLLGTAQLTKASIPELDQLYKVLDENPSLIIHIDGHVCCGDEFEVGMPPEPTSENMKLSTARAKKIYHYLIRKGIPSERLGFSGWGYSKPLRFPENNTDDEYENRRIEVRLVKRKETYDNYLEELGDLPVDGTLTLKNIHFEWGRYNLTKTSFEEVKELAFILKKYPKLHISIEGHVCCGRKEEAKGLKKSHLNTELSINRAKEVKKFLVLDGINETRIACTGFGFNQPLIYPERDEDDRASNRRTVIRIVKR